MKDENLVVFGAKQKKYSSYLGAITPEVENVLCRNFHADNPNEKWLTDITKFALPEGKPYLSPLIDCFDGLVVNWTVGRSPNAALVNTSWIRRLLFCQRNNAPSSILIAAVITGARMDRTHGACWSYPVHVPKGMFPR